MYTFNGVIGILEFILSLYAHVGKIDSQIECKLSVWKINSFPTTAIKKMYCYSNTNYKTTYEHLSLTYKTLEFGFFQLFLRRYVLQT